MEGGAAGAMGGGGAAEAGQGAPLQPAPFFYALPHRRDGNEPGPRCGHTLTPLNVADGAPPRLVLFGGATALESGSSQATPGGNGIRANPGGRRGESGAARGAVGLALLLRRSAPAR